MNLLVTPSIIVPDMWDPNTWDLTDPVRRIYLDDKADLFCLVDEVDYLWALQWRWQPKRHYRTKKIYACRTTRYGQGANFSVYLHIEIHKRAGVEKPTEHHKLVDHRDGHERNCRRENLRWATHSMNARNIRGSMPHDLIEDFMK